MRKRKVVIRQLRALEALGGVTNICSDKTGTFTQGQMITRKVWLPAVGTYTVKNAEEASDPANGSVSFAPGSQDLSLAPIKRLEEDNEKHAAGNPNFQEYSELSPNLEAFLQSTAPCNLATVRYDTQKKSWQTTGDPTEVALQVFAHRFDRGKKTLEERGGWGELTEYPFDGSIKMMSVMNGSDSQSSTYIFTKGAVERVVELRTSVGIGENQQSMSEELK